MKVRFINSEPDERFDECFRNLEKLVSIYTLRANDYQKALDMCKIYKNAADYRQAYRFVFKCEDTDPRFVPYLSLIEEMYAYYKKLENSGIISNINYVFSLEEYLNSYSKAASVLESFIESDHSYNLFLFLKEQHVSKDEYEFYVKTVARLNDGLYQKYLEKVEQNKLHQYDATLNALKNIAHGIRTGYLFDGTPFNKLAFWVLVPFKYSHSVKKDFEMYRKVNPSIHIASSFVSRIEAFTEATMKDDSKVIMNYIRKNKLHNYTYVSKENLRKMYYGTLNIKKNASNIDKMVEVQFTPDDVTEIIQMMEERNYPFLIEIFNILKEDLINQKANEALEKKNTDSLCRSITLKKDS